MPSIVSGTAVLFSQEASKLLFLLLQETDMLGPACDMRVLICVCNGSIFELSKISCCCHCTTFKITPRTQLVVECFQIFDCGTGCWSTFLVRNLLFGCWLSTCTSLATCRFGNTCWNFINDSRLQRLGLLGFVCMFWLCIVYSKNSDGRLFQMKPVCKECN